jgi:hypothetical protein
MPILYFNVFDIITKQLLYTKYSFNFDLYSSSRNLDANLSKTEIFSLFLKENGTTFDKPYSLSQGLEIFFKPVTQQMIDHINLIGNTHFNYMSYTNPDSYIPYSKLIEQQFDLIHYDDTQIRFIQDYTYTTNKNGLKFTKYNFDFDSYSNDFNIWGSKLLIFTDFVVRCINLSNSISGSFGYGLPDQFVKYFIVNNEVEDYLVDYGVTSNDLDIFKNPKNIDWDSYAVKNTDLKSKDHEILKKHYYMYGQFEIRPFNFLQKTKILNSDLIINSTANIFSISGNKLLSTGFLYSNGDEKIYLVTCYHSISESNNLDILRASFSINTNVTNIEGNTIFAEFRVIGYDIFSDVIIGLFDPNLPYNSSFNVDLSSYKGINLASKYSLNKGNDAFFIGNIGQIGNNVLLSGKIMNEKYNGNYLNTTLFLGAPDSILIDTPCMSGISGSPIWIGNPEETDGKITCIGMINSCVKSTDTNNGTNFAQGVHGKILKMVINNIIHNWSYIHSKTFSSDNLVLNSYLLKFSSKLTWMGIVCSYFNASYSISKFPVLNNLYYNGGLVVENFILGFDLKEKKIIVDVNELSQFNAVKLQTPLLNTKMYKRFIDSSKTPIVIKSFKCFNALTSEFNKFNIGIYSNQVSYGKITYGLSYLLNTLLTKSDANTYLFSNYEIYPKVEIEYFYYNGEKWILDTESVGGSDESNYSTYTDPIGNKFYQHNFMVPYILYNYLQPYENGIFCVKSKDEKGVGQKLENLIKTQSPGQYILTPSDPEERKASGGSAILRGIAETIGGFSKVGNGPANAINEIAKNDQKKGKIIIPRKGR